MPNLQRCPLNLYQINNVEDIFVLLACKAPKKCSINVFQNNVVNQPYHSINVFQDNVVNQTFHSINVFQNNVVNQTCHSINVFKDNVVNQTFHSINVKSPELTSKVPFSTFHKENLKKWKWIESLSTLTLNFLIPIFLQPAVLYLIYSNL